MCLNGAEDIKYMLFSWNRVWRALGIWDNIFQLLNADRFGSVLLEEAIRKGGQVRSIDVGLAELILTCGWYI
jgi:hypothetical protein